MIDNASLHPGVLSSWYVSHLFVPVMNFRVTEILLVPGGVSRDPKVQPFREALVIAELDTSCSVLSLPLILITFTLYFAAIVATLFFNCSHS